MKRLPSFSSLFTSLINSSCSFRLSDVSKHTMTSNIFSPAMGTLGGVPLIKERFSLIYLEDACFTLLSSLSIPITSPASSASINDP